MHGSKCCPTVVSMQKNAAEQRVSFRRPAVLEFPLFGLIAYRFGSSTSRTLLFSMHVVLKTMKSGCIQPAVVFPIHAIFIVNVS